MPLYEYFCQDCEGVFELLRPAREASLPQPCPECDEDAKRLISKDFAAFIFRDGLPRRLPDRGTYWHLGKEVSKPITGPTAPNEHPELAAKKKKYTMPTREELERAEFLERQRRERLTAETEVLGKPIVREDEERQRREWAKRLRATAKEIQVSRKAKPNIEVTPRTTTGDPSKRAPKNRGGK